MENKELPAEVGRWLDELFVLLFDPMSKGDEHEITDQNRDKVTKLNERDVDVRERPNWHHPKQRD